MKKNLFILGSTGSIGETALNVIKKDPNKFRIKLLTTNNNVKKIYYQALKFNVKQIVIFNKNEYLKYSEKFKKKKIDVYFSIKDVFKKKRLDLF